MDSDDDTFIPSTCVFVCACVLICVYFETMFQALPNSRFSRHVERLNLLSSGAGSLLVPKEVKSVELVFKNRSIGGHLGAK